MEFSSSHWGNLNGRDLLIYTVTTESGLEVTFSNLGAAMVSMRLLNNHNEPLNLAYGLLRPNDYLKANYYPGVIVGRYTNRIEGAKFYIEGQEYRLTANEGNNILHGGTEGFSHKVWDSVLFEEHNGVCLLEFHLKSPDGDEGFPGNVEVWVIYQITDDNQISISYRATTDKPTHINLTTHGYFNLGGFKGDVLDHMLKIDANKYLPVNSELIPTGELRDVDGSPFDFRKFKAIGADLDLVGEVYDHCFALNNPTIENASVVLYNPKTHIGLSIYTTQPGIQLYTPINKPNVENPLIKLPEKGNWAVCMEPQHFPNSPNTPHFPSTLLLPGEEYDHTTIFTISIGGVAR
jgi:aldose 1-epimerase